MYVKDKRKEYRVKNAIYEVIDRIKRYKSNKKLQDINTLLKTLCTLRRFRIIKSYNELIKSFIVT